MFSSNAAKKLASAALQTGKTAAKDIGMKVIDVGKTVAIDDGRKLVLKAAKKFSTPKSQVANVMVPPEEITKKVNKIIAKYVDTNAITLNKLIDGSSITRPNAFNAIVIQDLRSKTVKWIRFKSYIYFFLVLLKMMADILKFNDIPIIGDHEYDPFTGTNLSNGGDIRSSIESQDVFTQP